MKVLLISPLPPPYGGIANWTAMILEYAKGTDDLFRIINIAPKKRVTEGRNIFNRVVISGFSMIGKIKELKREIMQNCPDVIHMTTSGSLAIIRDILVLKTAKKFNVPTAYHIRFGQTAKMIGAGSKLWCLFKKAMETASVVIAIDKRTYDAIKTNVPKANVALIPNPIDIFKLPKVSSNNKKQIVFLGWVVPTKGVGELVKAWNTIGTEFEEYKLFVIGQAKPEYFKILKNMVNVKNIEFTGEMPHEKAMQVMAESEVFVLPSYTEGFPNALVEAMALKKAVIATDVGAIPEMLENNCGILISPQKEEEIVIALRKVLSEERFRKAISENAYSKVQNNYTIDTVYARYKEVWNKIRK